MNRFLLNYVNKGMFYLIVIVSFVLEILFKNQEKELL